MTAGIVLSIMIMPIITSVSREVFDTVPRNDKEGALALGRHPLGDDQRRGDPALPRRPHRRGDARARPGHGRDHRRDPAHRRPSNPPITVNVFGSGDAMPARIARYLSEASGDYRAALIGLGVTSS